MNASQAIGLIKEFDSKIDALSYALSKLDDKEDFIQRDWLRIIKEEYSEKRRKLLDTLWKIEVDFEE